jgi:uncharacterized protein (TIGR02284 family)
VFALSTRYGTFGRGAGFSRFLPLAAGKGESLTAGGPFAERICYDVFAIRLVKSTGSEKKDIMSSDESKNSEYEEVIKEVINILEDGQKGFADIGAHLKDETLKHYFLAESLKRANFRAELENELHRHGVHDVHEEGTAVGTLHRVWFDLKEKLHAADDHSLLASAEQGEDQAKKVYADALAQELPLPLRQLLTEQNAHIVSSHDYVRDHRNAFASK